jgi:hypothetical protein
MPKSRNRKNHKQKVINRNNLIKGMRRKMEAEYTEMLSKRLEEMKSEMSAMTEVEEATVVTEQ